MQSSAASQEKSAAESAANQVLGKFGSAAGIRENAYVPLTSDSAQMKTIDGSVSFASQVQCPSSREFVTVLLTPSAGGEAGITVGEDLDFDGNTEYSYSAPVNASGVCANGIISCSAGTWNGCKGYKWTANASGQTGLQEVSINDLGGCYCINNSCGSNMFFARSRQILETVGGGVIGSIQGLSPKYTVTEAKVDGTAITYHGQATGGCSQAGAGGSLPTSYYSEDKGSMPGLQLSGAGSAEATSQSADPNSYYSLLQSSYSQYATPANIYQCTIDRVGTVVTSSHKESQAPIPGTLCVDHLLFARIHKVDDWRYELQYLDTSPSGVPHNNCGAYPWEAPIGTGGWHTVKTIVFPELSGNYRLTNAVFSMQNIAGAGCSPNGSATLNGLVNGFDTQVNTGLVCPAKSAQFPSFSLSYLFEMMEEKYTEGISDGCAALQGKTDCSLMQETVDGVPTYSSFMPTGIVPLPSCRTFNGSFSTFLECRDWWKKERKYRCTTGTKWNFSDAKKRADQVTGSVTDNVATMDYSDLRKDENGQWVAEERKVSLTSPREQYGDPIMACKTRKPKRKTDAALSGNATQYLSNPDAWEFFYRRCKDGSCPVNAAEGEEIVKNCQNINEFAEAATIMNVLEEANRDMICSDGTKK